MSDRPAPDLPRGVPHTLLFATDLSARCDRAFDRAVALAEGWRAELFAVHALQASHAAAGADLPSWRRGPDPVQRAADRLHQDQFDASWPVSIVVAEGAPVEVILETAKARGADLIVTAISRDNGLERLLLGSTVDRLLKEATVPVLIVRQRPRMPYRRIVVATDVSEASRRALHRAVDFFPDQPLRVFHAYSAPHSALAVDPVTYRDAYGKAIAADLDAFLAASGLGATRIREVLVERGDPSVLIPDYLHTTEADLLVMGTSRKGRLLDLLVGSTARSVLEGVSCDALIVPDVEEVAAA
ncbi:universal stress protein [Aquabacter sp. L1I39]|uniref:universal stress protein n=1 Tax=Aquabacter sp. L1I39 TaxID=2820278 RepID=UPI001ADAB955|nr:universal stress protein [Aquabacter sp. L1I39]QTL01798.1 universal stress protein [Aquabacter sp. L1I39]